MCPLDNVFFDLELQRNRPLQVVGFGENAVDWVCRVPSFPRHDSKVQIEEMLRVGGGTIATACALVARWGLKSRYMGRVGDDELGAFALKHLRKEPLDLSVETVEGASSHCSIIIVDRMTGKRTIMWNRDSKLLYGNEIPQVDKIRDAQLLHLDGNDPAASIHLAKAARVIGIPVVLDIDKVLPRADELLALVDFAIPGLDFVQGFTGCFDWKEGLLKVAQLCPGFVAVTLGERGAGAIWQNKVHDFPAFTVPVVDSTGAGDIFHGAFIFSLFQGWSVGRCMQFSNAAGALACTRLGARASIPSLQNVLLFEERGEISVDSDS